MRILVLGGTAQSRELVAELHRRGGHRIIFSLAGRTGEPALPNAAAARVRVGGFGGAEGLAEYLRTEAVDVLVDATHPFARTMSEHAALAAEQAGIRLLTLRRAPWREQPGDRWIRVPDIAAAARAAAELPAGGCVLVTTGRLEAAAYAADDRHVYLLRSVTAPDGPLPPHHRLVLDRGPFTERGETELLARHDVAALVTKNSGGGPTAAKLTAARLRGIPVIIVDPPELPERGERFRTVAELAGALTA